MPIEHLLNIHELQLIRYASIALFLHFVLDKTKLNTASYSAAGQLAFGGVITE